MTSAKTVHLGFEVGSGDPVSIPLRHMVVTGQTQEAGKTTTLEALIARAGVSAIAFITKRGEGSFAHARIMRPYFREQADWQYVAAILEASRGEKLKFERPWIIRASRGASTLADVQRNVRAALADPKTKGLSADIYLVLNAYLDAVVPQIERVRWAQTVELEPGINAMDLAALNVEMQHLVIRSTIEWVLEHAEQTVVVVPEAWKFIPQGRNTPVKLAAEAFIRQAAAMRNYLWLDSQDIAGIEKLILKSVPVWLLGVQREVNEVKRTLDQMPIAVPKLKPRDIARLGLGQFYACHGELARQVYVQPVWMDEDTARGVARGDVARIPAAPARPQSPEPDEDLVNEVEAKRLRDENEQLRTDNADLRRRLEALERDREGPVAIAPSGAVTPATLTDAQRKTTAIRDRTGEASPSVWPLDTPTDVERLYQMVKARLIEETPRTLKVLAVKPELEVEVTRETLRIDGKSLRGRVAQLVAKGFFDEGVLQSHVRADLERRGAGVSDAKNLPREIDALVQMGFLTMEDGKDAKGRARTLYVAVPDMKVRILEGSA